LCDDILSKIAALDCKEEEEGKGKVLLIFSPWPYAGSMELRLLWYDSETKDNSIIITGKTIRHLIFNFALLANKTYIIYTLATVAFVSQKQEAIVNDTNTAELNRKY
jgi:hypothetical protein